MLRALLFSVLCAGAWRSGDELELAVGEVRVIRVPGLQRVAVSNVTCYDIKMLGRDELRFEGLAAGSSLRVPQLPQCRARGRPAASRAQMAGWPAR
ncbi:MAG: hypothetical protein JNJ54_26380 [Myxococcaceae bacterium]|nr:hypothetical protein [Myxococcaceae bacterium]